MPLTDEQAAVVMAPPGNMLVSAAAGSGKTRVLVDRIVRRLVDEQADIRQILVVTFTEAAARQMRERIEDELRKTVAAMDHGEKRQRLARQLSLLPAASVSTIHAFCLSVIRNFYNYALDSQSKLLVEPGFTVDDGTEADLLLSETLDEYLNRQYEAIDRSAGTSEAAIRSEADGDSETGGSEADGDSETAGTAWTPARRDAFYRLMDGYGTSRSDQPVRSQILSLHHFLRSLPNYPERVRRYLEDLAGAAKHFSGSAYSQALLHMLSLRLDHAMEAIPEIESILAGNVRLVGDSGRHQFYRRQMLETCRILKCLSDYLHGGGADWDIVRNETECLAVLELPRCSRQDPPDKQRLMDLFCSHVAEAVHFLSGSCGTSKYLPLFLFDAHVAFALPAAEIEAETAVMLPAVQMLFELVLGLDREYAARKHALGMLDFNDFEHMALIILRNEDVCRYYRRRYQEIYVDEYQDTSSIQEAIIEAVSSGNCLVVGDIKQSIYRFRHARPRIFLDRAAAYASGAGGQIFRLKNNFRSVRGILDAVNLVFSQLMSSGAGEIDYDESQALLPGLVFESPAQPPVRLMLVNRSSAISGQPAGDEAADPGANSPDAAETSEAGEASAASETGEAGETGNIAPGQTADAIEMEDYNRDQQEALAAVREMLALHEQGKPWKDMVVLARTRAICIAYREQLASCGIPAWMPAEESFFDCPAIQQIAALIHLLDNRRQDVPLAAVMRSSIFQGGFTVAEMALIRLESGRASPEKRFYHEAAEYYATHGPEGKLRQKLIDFLTWLDQLRLAEQVIRLSDLIGRIYAGTGWLERLAAQADGTFQIRRLQQFRRWSEQFEKGRRRGLFAFARFLEDLAESGRPAGKMETEETDQDVVRILTIHASKGLQFPIVFLAGTGYGLLSKDTQDPIVISESLGVGMDFADPERQIRYPSHLKLAMMEEIKAAGMAEEMRLLYVAMTRAQNLLYIAGTVRCRPGSGDRRLSGLVEQVRGYGGSRLPEHLVLSARNYLEWLIMALARQLGVDWSWLDLGMADGWAAQAGDWMFSMEPLPKLLDCLASRNLRLSNANFAETAETAETAKIAKNETAADHLPDHSSSGDYLSKLLAEAGKLDGETDETLGRLRKLIGEPYRFEQAARLPAKVTVSELKRQSQALADQLNDEEPVLNLGFLADPRLDAAQLRGISLTLRDMGQPAKSEEDAEAGWTGARLGTLLHAVIRYLDMAAARQDQTEGELANQVAAMERLGMLSGEEALAVKPYLPQLLQFVRSDLGAEIAAAADDPEQVLFTEIPFTLAVSAPEIYPQQSQVSADDQILVQGMIDCWFENKQGITLVDYKSDRLTGDTMQCQAELANRYGRQLELYARAIETATGKTVRRRLIWLIRQGQAYDLSS